MCNSNINNRGCRNIRCGLTLRTKYLSICIAAFMFLAAVSMNAYSRGTIDNSFGNMGIYRYTPNGGVGVTDFVVLPNSQMLISGRSLDINTTLDFSRIDKQGAPDPMFGSGTGHVRHGAPAVPYYSVEAFAVDRDYSIFAAGDGVAASNNAYVVKLKNTGAIDTSFATNGVFQAGTHVRLDANIDKEINAVAVQPDDKIIVAGRYLSLSGGVFLLRLNENGTPDTTFGPMNDGLVFLGPLTASTNSILATHFTSIKVLDSGEIVASGFSQLAALGSLVARFTPDGVLDHNFNGNGLHLLPNTAGNTHWSGHLEVDHLGQVYLLSRIMTGAASCVVTKFLRDGVIDLTFGTGGSVLLTPPAGEYYNCGSIALVSEGGIAISAMGAYPVAGAQTNGPPIIFRLDHNGIPDPLFGNQGITQVGAPWIINSTYYTSLFDNVFVDLQSDGRLVFVTSQYQNSGNVGITLGRINDHSDNIMATPNGFRHREMQPTNSWVNSNIIQIQGLNPNTNVVIEVLNGQYSVNGLPYTTTPGYVRNGDLINVRNYIGSSPSFTATTTLRVGGFRDRKNAGMVRGDINNYEFIISTNPINADSLPLDLSSRRTQP